MSCPLTIEEQADITLQQDMVTFRENTEERLGAKPIHAELEDDGIPDTPEKCIMLMKIRTR